MATNSGKPMKKYGLCCPIIAVLFAHLAILTYLLLVTDPEQPAVAVSIESTTPRSSRGMLNNTVVDYTIDLGLRVHNSLSNYTLSFDSHYLHYYSGVGPGCEVAVVSAVTHWRHRDDVAVADDDSRFGTSLHGSLWYKTPGDYFGRKVGKFVATCRDLAVDLDRWTERVQKVDCDVSVHVLRHDFRDYVLIYDSAASPPQRFSRRLMLVKFIRNFLKKLY